MIECIPAMYMPIEKEQAPKKKVHKRDKQTPVAMSMVDLKLKAQGKIEAIQQTNRDKSMAKIAALTQMHKTMQKPEPGTKKDYKEYKSKGKLDESKLDNKRKQKQANKAKKINQVKGIPQIAATTSK